MRITERRLRQIIRNVIKESQINEMMDMRGFGTSNEIGPYGDLESMLSMKMPRYSRETERVIRETLIKLGGINDLVWGSALGTVPLVAASLFKGHPTLGAIGVGVFIASALSEMYIKNRVGAEDIEGIDKVITYLDKNGHRRKASVEKAVSDILDKEGY